MKRSEINQIIRDAEKFLASRQFVLPEWANWSLADWQANKDRVEYITERMLGWDITDFGSGDFLHRGLFLFTIRNGKYGVDKKPYAEKIMIVGENQETPMHFHWSKMEDIINRGGGNLVIELYNAGKDEPNAGERHSVAPQPVLCGIKVRIPQPFHDLVPCLRLLRLRHEPAVRFEDFRPESDLVFRGILCSQSTAPPIRESL